MPVRVGTLANSFPSLAAEWHLTKNGDITPDNVAARSGKKYWWKCPEGPDHEWQATLVNRTHKGSGCPCCAGIQASATNSLASLYPELAFQWHPTKNGDLTPSYVVARSAKKRWWKCPE